MMATKTKEFRTIDAVNDVEYINSRLAESEKGGTMTFEEAYNRSQKHIENLSF